MRSLLILLACLALLTSCRREGEVNVEILAHDGVRNLRIGNREIGIDSKAARYLGIDLPLGKHEVAWESDGRRLRGQISVESNSDNYLLLLDKEPYLEVDGGMKVLKKASEEIKETF